MFQLKIDESESTIMCLFWFARRSRSTHESRKGLQPQIKKHCINILVAPGLRVGAFREPPPRWDLGRCLDLRNSVTRLACLFATGNCAAHNGELSSERRKTRGAARFLSTRDLASRFVFTEGEGSKPCVLHNRREIIAVDGCETSTMAD